MKLYSFVIFNRVFGVRYVSKDFDSELMFGYNDYTIFVGRIDIILGQLINRTILL